MGMTACFAPIDATTADRLRANPGTIEDFLYPGNDDGLPEGTLDVDKAWHGIHYLLTGSADGGEPPLAWAVVGGDEIGDDVGYGPARLLAPAQVRAIADALPDERRFAEAYAPAAMAAAQVYPEVIWERDGDEALDYLVENYRSLVVFYRDAAARGDGLVLWLC